jgi:hypothetical protein
MTVLHASPLDEEAAATSWAPEASAAIVLRSVLAIASTSRMGNTRLRFSRNF